MHSSSAIKEGNVENKLEIFTLGRFQVRRHKNILTAESKRARLLWNLFKYFVANRNRSIPKEELFDALWRGEEPDNPSYALKTLVYRLRKIIGYDTGNGELFESTQEGYAWSANPDCYIDADEFDMLCREAGKLKLTDPGNALLLYKKAIGLYKGDYLPDENNSEWVIPRRYQYKRVFMDSVYSFLEILKSRSKTQEIVEACEGVFLIEPYEEGFHEYYIQALLDQYKTWQAIAHYEYITGVLYNELGVKPSSVLRGLYQRMKKEMGNLEMDLSVIQKALHGGNGQGVCFCELDVFQQIYRLEERRVARKGQDVFIALLTFVNKDDSIPEKPILEKYGAIMEDILRRTLRAYDAVTRWCEAQYLILLTGVTDENGKMILKRIKETFTASCKEVGPLLKTKLQPVLAPRSHAVSEED